MFPAAARIRELASARGMTIKELCAESQISPNVIRNSENSGRQISLSTVEKICETLNISLHDFFTAPLREKNLKNVMIKGGQYHEFQSR